MLTFSLLLNGFTLISIEVGIKFLPCCYLGINDYLSLCSVGGSEEVRRGELLVLLSHFTILLHGPMLAIKKNSKQRRSSRESNECYFTLVSSAITAGWGNSEGKALRGLGRRVFIYLFLCLHTFALIAFHISVHRRLMGLQFYKVPVFIHYKNAK